MGDVSITGRQTTAGVAEESISLSKNGAVAAATVAVAAGKTLVIADVVITAEVAARFRLQKTTDGSTFFDILLIRQPSDGTGGVVDMGYPVIVQGGTNVAIRIRAETAGGVGQVGVSLRCDERP